MGRKKQRRPNPVGTLSPAARSLQRKGGDAESAHRGQPAPVAAKSPRSSEKLERSARKSQRPAQKLEQAAAVPKQSTAPTQPVSNAIWGILLALAGLTAWAYWPTLVWMEEQWRTEPDYSHGYIVAPLAALLLYFRRDSFPGKAVSVGWAGVILLLLAVALRIVGRLAYMDFLDGWTLVPWVGGLVWLMLGRQVLFWAWPAVVFLLLMTPLPYQAESLLSFRLQGVATTLSTMALQTMGFVAIPEGNTIWLGEQQLMVEEACSGLRILMGMVAMGFFFMILSDRCWLDRLIIVACCIPIAIAVNVLRVLGTGLAYYWLDPLWAHQVHDLLGVAMILAGAAMFFGVKQFWEHLYRPLEVTMLQRRLVAQ